MITLVSSTNKMVLRLIFKFSEFVICGGMAYKKELCIFRIFYICKLYNLFTIFSFVLLYLYIMFLDFNT